jgi:hypothetical protein
MYMRLWGAEEQFCDAVVEILQYGVCMYVCMYHASACIVCEIVDTNHVHTHTHKSRTYTQITYIYIYTQTMTYTHISGPHLTRICMYVHIHTYIHTYTPQIHHVPFLTTACLPPNPTHTRTHTHTHTNTYIHTHRRFITFLF